MSQSPARPVVICAACGNSCRGGHLMCSGCWRKVSLPTQEEVYKTNSARLMSGSVTSQSWKAWALAAIKAVEEVNPNSPRLRSLRVIAGVSKVGEPDHVAS
jgi:hypothetical protein